MSDVLSFGAGLGERLSGGELSSASSAAGLGDIHWASSKEASLAVLKARGSAQMQS